MNKRNMPRRILSLGLSLALLSGVCIWPVTAEEVAPDAPYTAVDLVSCRPGAEPFGLNISLYGDADTCRSFSWLTDGSVAETEVTVTPSSLGAAADFTAGMSYSGKRYQDNYNEVLVSAHQVDVTGLTPGETYSYRAGGEGHYVYGTLTVARTDGELTVLHLTDSQTRDAAELWQWQCAARTAVIAAGGAENVNLAVHTGDILEDIRSSGDTEVESPYFCYVWSGMLEAVRAELAGIPFLHVPGNHDTYWRPFYGYMYRYPLAGKTNDAGYFSYEIGNVHLTVLDTNQGVGNTRANRMQAWCEADLAAARDNPEIDWVVIALHNGPYTTGFHDDAEAYTEILETYTPIFSAGHVDLVLQGHNHVVSKSLPYRWDSAGYTTVAHDSAVVNFDTETVTVNGVICDNNPGGTYYVDAGTSGHRRGDSDESFRDNVYKSEIGTLTTDSPWGRAGATAGLSPDAPTFGILRVNGDTLCYELYAAIEGDTPVLLDTLAVYKGDPAAQSASDHSVDGLLHALSALPETVSAEFLPSVLAAVRQYLALDGTARAALTDLYRDRLDSYLTDAAVCAALEDAFRGAYAGTLRDAETVRQADGTVALRLVAAVPEGAVGCGFTVTAGGRTLRAEATVVYTAAVIPDDAHGLTHRTEASGDRLYALTVAGLSDDPSLSLTVTPYARIGEAATDGVPLTFTLGESGLH